MKEELVENLKKKILEEIANKANDAEQLRIEIENEGRKSIEETYIATEFKQDLEKVEKELHQLNDERTQLEINLTDIENLNKENESLESALTKLEKDKTSLEQEIKSLEGKSEFKDGILQKTTLQEKYETELQSVMQEIENKNSKLDKSRKFVQLKQGEIDKLLEKYHIQDELEQEQKAQEETKQEPLEQGQKAQEETKQEIQEEATDQEKNEEKLQQEIPVQAEQFPKKDDEIVKTTNTQPQSVPFQREKKEEASVKKQNHDSITKQPTVQIQNIACKVLDGGVPVYTVYMKMPDNRVVPYETSVNVGKDGSFKQLSKDEARRIEYKYNIIDASRYYDINLENVLAEVDRTYGTEGVKQYQTLMKTREGASVLDIDYNFSELYQTPTDPEAKMQLKSLRKLAKANYNLGLASYEKAPNLFKRLWKKITQKKLISREQERPNETPQEIDNKDDQIQMQGKQLDPLEKKEQVLKAFQDLHDEPGFNVRRFAKAYNLSPEETREYINLQHKSGSTNREKFIKSIEVKKDELDTQKSIGKSVDEILKENQTDDNKKEKLQEEEQK